MDEKRRPGISRRDFVGLATAGAAAVASSGVLSPLEAQAQGASPRIPARWDLEADVVVIGFRGNRDACRHQGCGRWRLGDRRGRQLRRRRARDL